MNNSINMLNLGSHTNMNYIAMLSFVNQGPISLCSNVLYFFNF